jgi:hypothetical protein
MRCGSLLSLTCEEGQQFLTGLFGRLFWKEMAAVDSSPRNIGRPLLPNLQGLVPRLHRAFLAP